MTDFYVTFGPDDAAHGPSWLSSRGYVRLTATSDADAREIARKWFGWERETQYGTAYMPGFCNLTTDKPDREPFFPDGLLGYASRDELRKA